MLLNIIYFLIGLLTLLILRQIIRTLRLYITYKQKYGDKIIILFYPILGYFYYLNKSQEEHNHGQYFFKKLCRDNPKAKGILFLSGLLNQFIAIDNEWIQYLSQDQEKFYKNDGPFGYSILFGDSLFFTIGNKWKKQRNLLNSSFHYDALKSRVPLIKEESKLFLMNTSKNNKNKVDEDGYVKLNIFHEVEKITSEVIARSFFNREFKNVFCQNNKQISNEMCDITQDTYHYRIINLFFIVKSAILGNKKASLILNTQTEKELLKRMYDIKRIIGEYVEESIKEVEKKSNGDIYSFKPNNFSEVYIKEYLTQQKNLENIPEIDRITIDEIIQQYNILFFAGTDTTAHLTSMTLYALSQNKEIYTKLLEEISQNVISYDDFNHNDLGKLVYLDAVLKETLRFHNIGPYVFPRRTNQDYVKNDLYISKDLSFAQRIAQFRETGDIFQNSDVYNPDRYLKYQMENPYDNIPFSSGSRNCIGQHMAILEAKYILMHILMNFEIKPVPNYKLKMIQAVVNQPLDKELILIKRK